MRPWRWVVLTAVVLAAAGGFLLVRSRGPRPVVVDVETAVRRPLFQSYVTASGEIVASRYADIGSSVFGRLVDLKVAEGQAVRTGQVLARIDPVQAESDAAAMAEQLRALEGDAAAAAAHEKEAAQSLARTRQLHAQGVLPRAELDSAVAAADSARAQAAAAGRRVAQGRAQVRRTRDTLAKTAITSPMDGVVTRLSVREGEMVVVGIQNQPGTILLTVSDLSAIDAEVKVAEADVLRLARGQTAAVTLEAVPGREFPGQVTEIGASALPVTGTGTAAREFRVVVRLDRPDPALRPGLTCDARILAQEERDAVTVPLQAVVLRPAAPGSPERSGVFAVENGRARFVPVTTGILGGLDVAVTGIAPETPIVAGPFQILRELQDGASVERREVRRK